MNLRRILSIVLLLVASLIFPDGAPAASADGNRLAYLDSDDPFYPHRNFPKLTTPQWVGEPGVEAVVILAIDDMRETPKYETFLRPILERLKRIDGRAPVSIMVNAITPTNAQLQGWLKEGLSLEVHTLAHPCPCLAKGDFAAAANTYHGCVELMNQIPGNKPVAFRMPCCDSMNSPSPRFYAEIFNRANAAGQFLTIDSSVMCLLTTNDPALPRALVLDADGREKFRKYFPTATNATTRVSLKNFATTIEDYPYPYVIGRLCWEFPAMVPSDWEAFNLHGATNPVTLADWKAALDAVVLKQGVFSFIFHPHGWSSPAQFVEFIDYAVAKYGKRVKFLNFREAQDRLNENLSGQLRVAKTGKDNGIRWLDVNNDGFLEVIGGNISRWWHLEPPSWLGHRFDLPLAERPARFGIVDNTPVLLWFGARQDAESPGSFVFEGDKWRRDEQRDLLSPGALADLNRERLTSITNIFRVATGNPGLLLRDLDRDGSCELIIGLPDYTVIGKWESNRWRKLDYALPRGTSIVDAEGRDAGLRFIDVNGDGYDDVLFSNEERFSLHLFVPKANPRLMWKVGWNDEVFAGKRGESPLDIPMIVRGGTNRNNGVWFKHGTMWVQNEDTAHLPDKVDRRSFKQLLTADQPPPKSPAEALAAFTVRPGFKVELVAAEPLVKDPIAFEWGADGRLWVVEMGDYPAGLPLAPGDTPARARPAGEWDGVNGRPGGRIVFLEDTDGDGRYDKSTAFLDGVPFPTGVFPWRKGVIVAAAPDIFYAEDTDGDGKAGVRRTLFTGFVEGNQQHRLNGFAHGLDNWIYGANGDSGGNIVAADVRRLSNNSRELGKDQSRLTSVATKPVSLRNHDFRFRPDEGLFEAVAGQTQYGRHRDDWGNWFGNNNPTWLWHYFLPEHYLARNPHLAVKTTRHTTHNYPESTRLYPTSRTRQRFNDPHQFQHVTSGCGLGAYRDELFGPDFATSVFICDPVHNLVHREVLAPDGVTFASRRAPGEATNEFLSSSDNWFRPVQAKTGPDGALYVADMYRHVLEHPEWIPKHIQARLDLRAGDDKGRIYRVLPDGATPRKIPRLDQLDTAGLVAALDSANGWQRDTAQRLLVHQPDKRATEPLKRLAVDAKNPKARLQALCTLDGLAALTAETLVSALRDAHPAVREHAVRLSETFAVRAEGGTPNALLSALLAHADDSDARVRYQLAFTLGEWNDPRAGAALVRLAARDRDNAHLQTAVLSSATNHVAAMLAAAFSERADDAPADFTEKLLGLATALHRDDAIAVALANVAAPAASRARQFSAFAVFLDALARRNVFFEQFARDSKPPFRDVLRQLEKLFPDALRLAGRSTEAEAERLAAIRLLGRFEPQRDGDLKQLSALLRPEHSAAIHQAAVNALTGWNDAEVAGTLLAGWKTYSPNLRAGVLAALFSRPAWVQRLLTEIERGGISPGELSAPLQQQLRTHANSSIQTRAVKLFSATRADRQALLNEYQEAGKLAGDPVKGAALFRQNCAPCHRFKEEGANLGVDLGTVAGKPVEYLLEAILDPNKAVESRYLSFTAVTKADREFSGIITAESPNSLTLRNATGEETILRADLKELTSSGRSLMPEGLEQALPPQAMADLIAFIKR